MLQVDRRAKLRLQQLGVIERSGHAVASRNDQRRRIVGECRNELGAPVVSPSFNSVRPPRSLSCSNFSQSFPATARAISQVMSGSPWSTRHTTGARGCVVCPCQSVTVLVGGSAQEADKPAIASNRARSI